MPQSELLQKIERKMAYLNALVVAGLAFGLVVAISAFVLAAWVWSSQSAHDMARERKSNAALACYILPQLDRASKTLPTLEYYVQHPRELAAQLKLLAEQRETTIKTWGECPSAK